MKKLQAGEFQLDISDFAVGRSIVAIDSKFGNKETFYHFLEFSKKHCLDKTSIDYEIDGEKYHGHFGNFIYDSDYNVRFYMTTDFEDSDYGVGANIWKDNLNSIIEKQRTAIEKIANILSEKNLVEKDEINEILQYIPEEDYGAAISHKVSDLNKYLSDAKEALDDLKKNNK